LSVYILINLMSWTRWAKREYWCFTAYSRLYIIFYSP